MSEGNRSNKEDLVPTAGHNDEFKVETLLLAEWIGESPIRTYGTLSD
jgi:hypothetical protein